MTNRVTSQCKLMTIIFQALQASRHIFSRLVWVGDTIKVSQKSPLPGFEPRTYGLVDQAVTPGPPLLLHVTLVSHY